MVSMRWLILHNPSRIITRMSTDEKQYHPVARASEIVPGMGKLVEAAGAEIAVFHFAGAFYAVSNRCPHRGASLADGFLEAGKVPGIVLISI
jgi:nitrite reductase/ring-hydroxylating ferredoxin subunit